MFRQSHLYMYMTQKRGFSMDLIQEGVWTNQSNRNEIWDGRIDDPNMAIWVSKIRKPKIKILLLKTINDSFLGIIGIIFHSKLGQFSMFSHNCHTAILIEMHLSWTQWGYFLVHNCHFLGGHFCVTSLWMKPSLAVSPGMFHRGDEDHSPQKRPLERCPSTEDVVVLVTHLQFLLAKEFTICSIILVVYIPIHPVKVIGFHI